MAAAINVCNVMAAVSSVCSVMAAQLADTTFRSVTTGCHETATNSTGEWRDVEHVRGAGEILNWYFVPRDRTVLKRVPHVVRRGEEMCIAFPCEM
jgi:hypothetical protein